MLQIPPNVQKNKTARAFHCLMRLYFGGQPPKYLALLTAETRGHMLLSFRLEVQIRKRNMAIEEKHTS